MNIVEENQMNTEGSTIMKKRISFEFVGKDDSSVIIFSNIELKFILELSNGVLILCKMKRY